MQHNSLRSTAGGHQGGEGGKEKQAMGGQIKSGPPDLRGSSHSPTLLCRLRLHAAPCRVLLRYDGPSESILEHSSRTAWERGASKKELPKGSAIVAQREQNRKRERERERVQFGKKSLESVCCSHDDDPPFPFPSPFHSPDPAV